SWMHDTPQRNADDPAYLTADGGQLVVLRAVLNHHWNMKDRNERDIVRSRVCCLTPGGDVVGTIYANENLRTLNVIAAADDRVLATLAHQQVISAAELSPDGRTAATATVDGVVHLWHVATGERIGQFETRAERVLKLQFSEDGLQLAAATIEQIEPCAGGVR